MFGILSVCLTTCIRKKKMANGFRGEQSAKAAKKRSKDFDFPEKAFGAGKKKPASRAAKKAAPKGMADRKGKGPARTIAEAKRRGLSTFTDKSGKKKAAVTAEELKASGLSLRDYLNKQQGKTRAGPKAPTTKPTSKPKKTPVQVPMGSGRAAAPKKTPVQVPMGSGRAAAPKKTPIQEDLGSGRRPPKSVLAPKEGGTKPPSTAFAPKERGTKPPSTAFAPKERGRRGTGGKGTPYMGMGMKAGGMKKGYSMGGMKKKGMAAGGLNAAIKMVDKQKKGMAAGGMKKKGYSMGGMRKKGFSAGKSVRGVGKATKGFRPVKMVMMTKGGKKGGKKRR